LDAHDQQEVEQQRSVPFAHDVGGAEKRDEIDAEGDHTFGEPHA
jgi:hypothetical protein